MQERFSFGAAELLGEDQIAGICCTSNLARDNDVWDMSGVDLTNYLRNPIVLKQHDPDQVIGCCTSIGLLPGGDAIGCVVTFAPIGASAAADECRQLAKSGILRAFSAGVSPQEWEPLNPGEPFGAMRLVACELLEISLVAIGADPDALVTQRGYRERGPAAFQALPRVSESAIARALRFVSRPITPPPPPALRTPAQHFAAARQHTITAWAASRARQQNDDAAAEETTQRRRRTRWRNPFGAS